MGRITSGVGLVTGINIEETVAKLLEVQAKPRDNLIERQKALNSRQAAVTELTALTLGVQLSAKRLKNAELFTQKAVVSSSTSILTAKAGATAASGVYQFVAVRKAQTHHALSGGVPAKDQPLGAGSFSFGFGGFVNEAAKLDDFNGGDGITRGKIKITDRNGASAVIDLRYAVTVDDVLAAINQNESIDVRASVSGDQFVLTDTSGGSGNLRVDEVNSGTTAASLGLGGINTASSSATGQDLFRLYEGLSLRRLNGGAGISFNAALADLQVTFRDGSSPLEIDFHRIASAGTKASVTTTAAAGLNGQITLSAVNAGDDLNGVTVQFTSSGALTNGGATVTYDDQAKTITFDIDPGQTTASDLVAAATNDTTFKQHFAASLPTGGDGTGLVDLADAGVLAGGVDALEARTETTLGDVLETLNSIDPARLKAELSGDGDRIVLTDLTADQGGAFAVTDVNGGTAAEKLGLTGTASGDTLSGARLMSGLKTTLLSSLNGGRGFGELGDVNLTDRSGAQATVNLANAETLDDVIGAINSAGIGVRAEYNANRNGIQLVDTTGATTGPLVVADGDGTNTATKLGLAASVSGTQISGSALKKQVVSEQTTLDSYLGGKGVARQSLRITDSSGKISAINLGSLEAETVGDVINAINALSIGVEARINDAGDGIALVDTAGGSGTLKVEEVGSGTAAADLRIKGEATTQTINGQPTQVIDGSTTLTVTLDADDTLEDLVTKINEFGLVAKASIITETAGTVKHRLSLQSLVDGKQGELLLDGTSLGLGFDEITAAQDGLLQFGVNGSAGTGTLLASSNNIYKDAATGIDVTVLAASTDTVTVTASESSTSLSGAVQTFVDQYNKLRDKLATYTAYNSATNTKGVLFGSSEALRLDSDMSRMLTNPIRGLGSVESLAELGLSLDDKGKLSFDSTKLAARFETDGEAITKFFSDETGGFAVRADQTIEQLVGLNKSVLLNRVEVLQRQIEDQGERINKFNERLENSRELLLKQFYNMELLIGRIRSNLDAIGSIQYIPPVNRGSG